MVPAWFLAFSALVYASGFLAVTTFLDRFGIRESGIGLWKAKYVYVGLFCVALPLVAASTIYGIGPLATARLRHLRWDRRRERPEWWKAFLRTTSAMMLLLRASNKMGVRGSGRRSGCTRG